MSLSNSTMKKIDPSTTRKYWLDLFTGTTWQQFLDAGANVSGFRSRRKKMVQKIKPGDYLICYLTGLSRFIGVLEVTSDPYYDDSGIWKDESFPWRMEVKTVIVLDPGTSVPIHDLRDKLSMFQDMSSPNSWTGRFRGSPAEWLESDAITVIEALHEAQQNPVHRPVDEKKLNRVPTKVRSSSGLEVTIPEQDEEIVVERIQPTEHTKHTEIQYLLLNLGSEMGFDVWVASNDRTREYKGDVFADRFRIKTTLPLQFDDATSRTIKLIDVLWLKGNAIVAAFEVESTTSIYSGLLRMSDLIAMQPNINIPLFIVAPDERRNKVKDEINRATFSRLSPPLVRVCRYISFTTLVKRLAEVAPYIRYLKSDFLNELAESCEID